MNNNIEQNDRESLRGLIEKFKNNLHQYKSTNYEEANVRSEFIDPFFRLLGWDIGNTYGAAEQYKDVQLDHSIHNNKKPDYTFRPGGSPAFFVEAKKPSINIKLKKEPAFQLREYGWTANLPLSILTDFEEFSIYDTSIKPDPKTDNTNTARVFYITFDKWFDIKDEEISNFDYVKNLFSRENVIKGSISRYEISNPSGQEKIDEDFLKTIDLWREKLSKDLYSKNQDKFNSIYNLNYSVQKIIDRILFLRIGESRNIEEDNLLFNSKKNYKNISKVFEKAREKYKINLFEDQWINDLKVDDKIINEIVASLYFPVSPYNFTVLPIEILGKIYEQFLSKEAELSENNEIIISKKPEVRKKDGIYYTPPYIVDYIVKKTLGEKLKKDKKPTTLRVLDIACGSGSFLVNAYEFLLNKYLEFYLKDYKKYLKQEKIYEVSENDLRLTINEKSRILSENIFGVDLDRQAVEVTQLSLLIKLLEDENINSQDLLFNYTQMNGLPDLSRNIKCGNSLIPDKKYEYESEFSNQYSFNWESEFEEIIEGGGFDCIIGNPPYIKEDINKDAFNFKNYSYGKYYKSKMDLWFAFACISIDLLKKNGLHSFIAINNWHTVDGASEMRKKFLSEATISHMINFNKFHIFEDADVNTMIYVIKKNKKSVQKIDYHEMRDNIANINYIDIKNYLENNENIYFKNFSAEIKPENDYESMISFMTKGESNLIKKIERAKNFKLKSKNVIQGIVGSPDKFYKIKDIAHFNDEEKKFIKIFHTGVERYYSIFSNEYIFYLHNQNLPLSKISDYPNIEKHFLPYKDELIKKKIKYKTPNKPYYALHRERDENFFIKGSKLISQSACSEPTFYFTEEIFYGSRALNFIKSKDIDLKYLCCFFNSNLMKYWFNKKGKKKGEGLQIDQKPLLLAPIIKNEDLYEKFISYHDNLQVLSKDVNGSSLEFQKTKFKNEINKIELEMNKEIYGLFNLNQDEINEIENFCNSLSEF